MKSKNSDAALWSSKPIQAARPRRWAALGMVAFLVASSPSWAAPAASLRQAADTSTNTVITCTNGALVQPTKAVFRGAVRFFDPQLYLECDLLNIYFPSNNTPGNLQLSMTPSLSRITSIEAQSNVLMMLRGATIISDRAVYAATNDIIHITGEIVAIETENGYAFGTNFLYDRRTMELHNIGPITIESKPGVSLMDSTNSFPGPSFNPNPANRPRRTPNAPRNP